MEQYQVGDRVRDKNYPKSIGKGTVMAVYPISSHMGAACYSYEIKYDRPIILGSPPRSPILGATCHAAMLERL